MSAPPSFGDTVRRQLAFLLDDHDFEVVSEEAHLVRLESETLGAVAVFDPRGEVELRVFRLRDSGSFGVWTYTGMVGRADVPRLLEIAGEQLRAEPAVLAGDEKFFSRLAETQERESAEWTAYYAGKGPRPVTGRLP